MVHREMEEVSDADTLLVVASLHELIRAPAAIAVQCLSAALARRPEHLHTWLTLVHHHL